MGNQRKAWLLRYVLRILHYFFVESDAKEICESCIFDNLNLSVVWTIFIFQAIGLESCESFQEETVSDQEGQYRLRGLQVTTLLKILVSCFGCKSVRKRVSCNQKQVIKSPQPLKTQGWHHIQSMRNQYLEHRKTRITNSRVVFSFLDVEILDQSQRKAKQHQCYP